MSEVGSNTPVIGQATYGAMGELTSLSGGSWGTEARSYNVLGQMTQLTETDASGVVKMNIAYAYSATQNNGKITSQADYVSGETAVYSYDALNRLQTAITQDGNVPQWGLQYAFDGFGSLTDQTVIKGSGPELHTVYSAATNRRSDDCADANGNIGVFLSFACQGVYQYDNENRLANVKSAPYGYTSNGYSYAPDNKRVWKASFDSSGNATAEELTYYSVTGQKMATYGINTSGGGFALMQGATCYYFGGRLVKNEQGFVYPDRLGSTSNNYYPFGGEKVGTSNNRNKYGTYYRDQETGLDYAEQRYYGPASGRFMTADPYQPSAGPSDPGSWNRYAYASNDPVNGNDPHGRFTCRLDGININCRDIPLSICDANADYFVPIATGCGSGGEGGWDPDQGPPREVFVPLELCHLEGLHGGYVPDPASPTPIHAIFASDVAALLDKVFADLNAQGIKPILEDGFRTTGEQLARNSVAVGWHEVGRAIDFKRSDPNLDKIDKAMRKAGFQAGTDFKTPDLGHYQLAKGVVTEAAANICTYEHPNGT